MSPPFRVLYFAHAPFISGAERVLLEMLRGLDRSQFQPALILGCDSDLAPIARSMDVPVRIIPMPLRDLKQWPAWWRSRRAIERELDRFRPHLVHANEVRSSQALSMTARRRGIPRVIHIRWPIDAPAMGWWARAGCEQIVCVCQWIRQYLGDTRGTPLAGARVTVIPDPIAWTARVGQKRDALPAPDADQLGGAGAAVAGSDGSAQLRLGYAGQLIEVKGLDLVIRAMSQLPPSGRPILLVAGKDAQTDGAYEQRLRHLASELGIAENVKWLGFLDDVRQLYRQVDAVVCPSRIEPLSLVPLEAAEFAIPALGSDLGGFRESIRPGETGYLVEPKVEAWVQALRSIKTPQQLAPLGRAARRHVIEHFSSTLYQQRLTHCYLELLGNT